MKEDERVHLICEYSHDVLHEGFPFDQIRQDLENKGIEEDGIGNIIKEIDDMILYNAVELKSEQRRFTFERSAVGVIVAIFLLLFYLASSYGLIEANNMTLGLLLFTALILSFLTCKKVKKPRGKFENRNKFKSD